VRWSSRGCLYSSFRFEDRSESRSVDGHSLGMMIDNFVWTDVVLCLVDVGCGFICVGACEEQVRKVLALRGLQRTGETSRIGSMDRVARRDQV
jgi:hypothetical protein